MMVDRKSKPQRKSGFTLIELVIAMSLIGLIALAAFASLDGVLRSREAGEAALDRLREERVLKVALRSYLQQAYSGSVPGTASVENAEAPLRHTFVGTGGRLPQRDGDRLIFSTLAEVPGVTMLPGAIAIVAVGVVSDPDSGENMLQITVQSDRALLDPDLEPFSASPLETDSIYRLAVPAESIELRYFDGNEWLDDWDSDTMGRLPWSVEVSVRYTDANTNNEPGFVMTTMLPVGSGSLDSIDSIATFQDEEVE